MRADHRASRAVAGAARSRPLTYSYRTDQELVAASQTASAYCMQNGSLPMTSRVTTNADGSRTVAFQCTR